jgi:1-acyl-sn-glycerol-3-phosphate acyltransferase
MHGGSAEDQAHRASRSFAWWLYQPYKYLVFAPALLVSTLILAAIAVLLCFVLPPRMVSWLCGVTWARINALTIPVRLRVEGREHVTPGQSYVVACNHQSHIDVLVLYGWLGVDFRWVMKQELRGVPGLGIACSRLGHIYIDRSNHQAALASIENAKQRIIGGTSVLFFPEGTRSRSGALGPFKKGAFHFAVDLGLPILPVTITGTRTILPPDGVDLMPGSARMIIHPPIETEGTDRKDIGPLMEQVRAAIAQPLGDVGAPDRSVVP